MRTKITVLLFTLLLSAPAFAQQPRIDSIAVDEDKGELILHGDFPNSASAVVTVDSVSLSVTFTSDTFLRATIPVSGRGSCGVVKVSVLNNRSNQRQLTYFHFKVFHYFYIYHSQGYYVLSQNEDIIHVRFDYRII